MQFLGADFFSGRNLMQSQPPICHQVVLGVGIDLVEITRIKRAIERWGTRFEKRVFTVLEIDYCSQAEIRFQRFAARFAAKEAALKALGTGLIGDMRWHDVEVISCSSGQPHLQLSGSVANVANQMGVSQTLLSLSHTENYAIANVILLGIID